MGRASSPDGTARTARAGASAGEGATTVRIAVERDLHRVGAVGRSVRLLCAASLPPDDADAVELALCEALNNVILHGDAGEGGGGGQDISLTVELAPGEVRLTLCDSGPPMPDGALRAAGADRFDFDPAALAALPEGGMGLALIRMSLDEVDHDRAAGRNRLRMVKRASRPPRGPGG